MLTPIVPKVPRKAANEPPKGFAVNRALVPGTYPLLEVFPKLEALEAFAAVQGQDKSGHCVLREVRIAVSKDDVWMYVAPRSIPDNMRSQWNPVVAPEGDVIVVGHSHLAESPPILLYLDILHELCHIVQRHAGQELWDEKYDYVDRPTELEAYEFVVEEARKLGATKPFMREYLRVEWVSEEDYQRLLEKMGLSGD